MSLDRTIAPKIHDAVEFDFSLPALNTELLPNGLPVYWLNSGVQDVAQIDWVFPAGIWYEPANTVANATVALMKNGTASRTSEQINEALEFYGAELKTTASSDYSTITLYTLTRHLEKLLPVVYEILTEAVFPEQELAIYCANGMQKLSVNLRNCDFVANRLIDESLFGNKHPYGRYTRKEDIERLSSDQLRKYYASRYHLANVKIFMAGKLDASHVDLVKKFFGGSLAPITETLSTPAYEPKPAAERSARLINDANGVQGAVRIGRLFPNRHHPDFAPMVVLNTLFGAYFGSRLMSNIREEKGYTYGIYSSLTPEVHGGSMVIHTETGRDVAEAAVKEVYHEMDLLCNELVDDEELLLVKNYLLGGLLADLDGPFSILRRWKTLILNGFSRENFDNNIRIYKAMDAKTLNELACKYLRKEDFHELIVI